MSLTGERCVQGSHSLRIVSPTMIVTDTLRGSGRPPGKCEAKRLFRGEDWSEWNRLSFWVYPTLPGMKKISLLVMLENSGEEKLPNWILKDGAHFFMLEPDRWNHIVWEIPHLARDKVTGVSFVYRTQGNEPGACEEVCYDIDQLELQQVEPDHFEGWEVAAGRISYSHSGYHPDFPKTALVRPDVTGPFQVIHCSDGTVVMEKATELVESLNGAFRRLTFTEVTTTGQYKLKLGDIETPPFLIDSMVWRDSIWKTINFFFCQRCGFEVEGVHGICHSDWLCEHEGKSIVINGGWHDAGDLSQALVNTADAVTAMLQLAESLTNSDELRDRLIEEARWGLQWVLKTRFGDGYRSVWAVMDFWTDGIIGTKDDVAFAARREARANLSAAIAEAEAARTFRHTNPLLAMHALTAARSDFASALSDIQTQGSGDRGVQLASCVILAAAALYEATDEHEYADIAARFAENVIRCQSKERPAPRVPAGFFYSDETHTRILHYSHQGYEHLPINGLVKLCRLLPDHPDRGSWHSCVAQHAAYQKELAAYTEPYGMLANSMYQAAELVGTLEELIEKRIVKDADQLASYRAQIENGIPLGEGFYVRRFPVWYDFRGNTGTLLSQTKALTAAATLLNDPELLALAYRQLEWVVGLNPFCQSQMYGEGHDYAAQYTVMSGDIVGSLPVGIETKGVKDVPYWPSQNCFNYKEVWVHPSIHWLAVMSDLERANNGV
ncbi:glycoside hydrolase family 9 protein [Paenibacillus sp. GCM10023252]